jgi:ornithine cyclodeaminase
VTRIVDRAAIELALPEIDLVAAAADAFRAHTAGLAVLPPVGELLFDDPPGDVHIKYGYLRGGAHYVIKVASGFYNNPSLGLPANNGLLLVFSRASGALDAILLDEGIVTDHRTAAAGACASRLLAPSKVSRIGVLGTGVQAALQLRYLMRVTPCRDVCVWGRDAARVRAFCEGLADTDLRIESADSPRMVAERCELIVTATASTEPLLLDLPAGRHVTAVGSDTPVKQELSPALMAQADIVAVDSLAQARERGEVFQACRAGMLDASRILELGSLLAGDVAGRRDDQQRTVADLTGIASQDLLAATALLKHIHHAE